MFTLPDETNTIIVDDFLNDDDTNKIILKKIVNQLSLRNLKFKQKKQLLTSKKELFVWFNDKDNIRPIGFDYEINKIDINDEKLKLFLSGECSNEEIVDSNFTDDEGNKIIDNKIIRKYNELFENNEISGNIIYFRTLKHF